LAPKIKVVSASTETSESPELSRDRTVCMLVAAIVLAGMWFGLRAVWVHFNLNFKVVMDFVLYWLGFFFFAILIMAVVIAIYLIACTGFMIFWEKVVKPRLDRPRK